MVAQFVYLRYVAFTFLDHQTHHHSPSNFDAPFHLRRVFTLLRTRERVYRFPPKSALEAKERRGNLAICFRRNYTRFSIEILGYTRWSDGNGLLEKSLLESLHYLSCSIFLIFMKGMAEKYFNSIAIVVVMEGRKYSSNEKYNIHEILQVFWIGPKSIWCTVLRKRI